MKALSGFRKICKNLNAYEYTEEYKKNKKLVEKSLKALEIIDKEFDIIGMINKAYAQGLIEISKEEYELLKEVLK